MKKRRTRKTDRLVRDGVRSGVASCIRLSPVVLCAKLIFSIAEDCPAPEAVFYFGERKRDLAVSEQDRRFITGQTSAAYAL